jgi:hypothetical protein
VLVGSAVSWLARAAGVVGAGVVPLPACEVCGHTWSTGGVFSSSTSVPSCWLTWPRRCSAASDVHEICTTPWRIGPCASCVANSDAPLWFVHAV